MKRIVVIGICLLLLLQMLEGGMAMRNHPEETYNFTIQLEKKADSANASVYFEGEYQGKTDKNGFFVFDTSGLESDKLYNLTFKKEGFRDCNITVYRGEHGVLCSFSAWKIRPTPTPPSPTPDGYKTHTQRIEELENKASTTENQTATLENITEEQETRLTALEILVQKIKTFLETLGFKD